MITLQLREPSSLPLEVDQVTPVLSSASSLAEIEQAPVFRGNQRHPLAEFFRITGTLDNNRCAWAGPLANVHGLGAHLTHGEWLIEADAGRHVGEEMSGGEISVRGSVGDAAGRAMRGGTLHIHGNAGDGAGGAIWGSPSGMRGGTLVIEGHVGHQIGLRMRRGLILVGGDTGEYPGFEMLAGTLLLYGHVGRHVGAGMKRGTIALVNNRPPQLLPTFRHGGPFSSPIVSLLAREVARFGPRYSRELSTARFAIHHGDLLRGGRGELWSPISD